MSNVEEEITQLSQIFHRETIDGFNMVWGKRTSKQKRDTVGRHEKMHNLATSIASQIPESYKKDEDVFVQIESYARDKGFSCSELLKACNDAGFCYEKYFEGKLGPGACPSVEMQEEAAKEALKVFPEKFLNYKK